MNILALALDGNRGWPDLRLDEVDEGLNVFHGPPTSAKTTVADLVAHVLYGQRLVAEDELERIVSPEGEVVVESRGRKYRLRRYHDVAGSDRLTVAALDSSPVDRETVRQLTCGLPPTLTNRLFVQDFRAPARFEWLCSDGFRRQLDAHLGTETDTRVRTSRKELIQRRDALAQMLESRLADQRRESRELDQRWQELDRFVHECKQRLEQSRDRLRAIETELAEIDSWLRCRRIEVEAFGPRGFEPSYSEQRLVDIDEQIARWRTTLSDLERREAEVRNRLTQMQAGESRTEALVVDQRAHFAATRRLLADLQGEVARLARANQADECVCAGAHPRIRPIVATLVEQVNALETLADEQELSARSVELKDEAERLAKSQVELRRQIDHLHECRRSLDYAARHRAVAVTARRLPQPIPRDAARNGYAAWESAPAELLTSRRAELWQKRGQLHAEIADLEPRLRKLRGEHNDVERRRTDVLSLRTIRELEQQLAEVQRELESSVGTREITPAAMSFSAVFSQGSTILAQISDGELVQLRVARRQFDEFEVVNRSGDARRLESLSPSERDQVLLSLSFAAANVCGQNGMRLPLVLDEPFRRLNSRETAALAAVLGDFAQRGHQVMLFTSQQVAAERCAAVGATLHDMTELLQELPQPSFGLLATGINGKTTRNVERVAASRRQPVGSGEHREAG